jgi:trimeric autotransporter adhesin
VLLVSALASLLLLSQQVESTRPPQPSGGCAVAGTAKSGSVPLPGVAITAVDGQQPVGVTSSNPDGTFLLRVPRAGTFAVRAELAAFAPSTERVVLDASSCRATLNFTLTLASRAPKTMPPPTPQAPAQVSAQPPSVTPPLKVTPPPSRDRRGPPSEQFRTLGVQADPAAGLASGESTSGESDALPAGFSSEAAVESVTSMGIAGQLNNPLLMDRFAGRPPEEIGDVVVGGPGGGTRGERGSLGAFGGGFVGGFGGGGFGPGFGGGGFGSGGVFGGPGGGGPGGGGFGGGPGGFMFGGRIRNEQIRGQFSATLAGSALDAAPYSLTGEPTDKPDYFRQQYSLMIGGPLKVPGLYKGDRKTSFMLNYSGNHSATPIDVYSTVPTAAARAGDFSSIARTIVDPVTGEPFAGNQIPSSRIDPGSRALLDYIPLPNQDGDRQNFRFTSTTVTNTDDVNLRLVHSFGSNSSQRQGRPPVGGEPGFGMGPASRFAGRGGVTVNFGLHYRRGASDQTTAIPTLAGASRTTGWDVPAGVNFSKWGGFHSIRLQFNRSRADVRNLYAGVTDVAGLAGIAGASSDPFDWGLPSLSFSTVSSLNDITPSHRLDQTIGLSYSVVHVHKRHALRWGGDVRWSRTDSRRDSNPNGSFVFTGLYTGADGTAGLDFADFLLGLPQEAVLQYGPGTDRFRSHSYDFFVQDDWRIRSNLTLNAGLRYEYWAPYSEASNQLATLDANASFTAVAPVTSGNSGPFTGAYPATLVFPDRNNFAPRVGLAWKPAAKWTLRGGYGVNYVVGAYLPIAQQLAASPPFATTATVLGTVADPILLRTVFASSTGGDTENTYGIDPGYRLGFVHIWNVDLQREVSRTFVVAVGYTGTRGGGLDIQRAPNRMPDGLKTADIPPFTWESSQGHSIMHSLTLRVRKRLTSGLSAGASYTLSKAMDNASTIGGGVAVVAQNDQDLDAEWGLSSFDQRQRLDLDATYELPFGPDRRWLNDGALAVLFGGWMWSGDARFATGSPYTARLLSNVSDVSRGSNGSLRADYNGAPIDLADSTIPEYFNTAAFSIPASGHYGTAGRNTIIGPGTSVVNMALTRNVVFAGTRGLSVRVQASNIFNLVQFASIDTVVNSPTFGRVISARPMRSVQVVARVRF